MRRRVLGLAAAGAIIGLAAGVSIGMAWQSSTDDDVLSSVEPTTDSATPSASATPSPTPSTAASAASCDDPATVSSADDLQSALDAAQPGDVIVLAPGTYQGSFVATAQGTEAEPITLCGPREAALVGEGPDDGYGLHLDGASWWIVQGFTVRNSQKGVMVDGGNHLVIDALEVYDIGDEAIHLRRFSSDNVVSNNIIHDTGHRRAKFGEGIYVGTAESNWSDISGGEPDTSDRNLIEGNTIYATSAEAVDIKEGTSDGILRGNSFDGAGMDSDGGDSWVDVKGKGWLIEGNTGVNAPHDGFQTHEIVDGWGTDNVFRNNTATVDAAGFGFSLTPERGNVVWCNNTVTGAREGYASSTCVNR